MHPKKRLFLNRKSIQSIDEHLKQHDMYKIHFVQSVLPHTDIRTLSNWLSQKTSAPIRDLCILAQALNMSLEDLTGEQFDHTYLSLPDSRRIKRMMKNDTAHAQISYGWLAAVLGVDIATLKNWIYRYSCISTDHYRQLIGALKLEPLSLENKRSSSSNALLDQQYHSSQQLRSLLLQHQALLSSDFSQIPQQVVDEFLQHANIPEKHLIFFHHNAQHNKDFYAVIQIEGRPVRCVLTFIHNSRVIDYGEISMSDSYVMAKNLFSGAINTAKPKHQAVKVATWFGTESCLFAIRSAEPFSITVDVTAQLTERDIMADEGIVIFFR